MSPYGSELRAAFDEWVRREINRMETEPERAAEVGLALRKVVAHETIQAWMWDIWARIRVGLETDIAKPNGRVVAYIQGAFGNLGAILEADPTARARLQSAAEGIIRTLPSILSILPSALSFSSPRALPAASFIEPLPCWAIPFTRSLSIFVAFV